MDMHKTILDQENQIQALTYYESETTYLPPPPPKERENSGENIGSADATKEMLVTFKNSLRAVQKN